MPGLFCWQQSIGRGKPGFCDGQMAPNPKICDRRVVPKNQPDVAEPQTTPAKSMGCKEN